MHYYKRNLGDYAKKAGRLSMMQHGAYTLLLDTCYDREQFPTEEEAIEWTWASTEAEVEAVKFVLRRFFVLEDGRYVQKRVEEELVEYHEKSEKNKRIAQDREAAKSRRERNVNETCKGDNESPPNQEPRTKNQEPRTSKSKAIGGKPPATKPEAVCDEVWADFLTLRKAKGAPLTDTALGIIAKEAEIAGIGLESALSTCCARGWQSFKADWYQNSVSRGGKNGGNASTNRTYDHSASPTVGPV